MSSHGKNRSLFSSGAAEKAKTPRQSSVMFPLKYGALLPAARRRRRRQRRHGGDDGGNGGAAAAVVVARLSNIAWYHRTPLCVATSQPTYGCFLLRTLHIHSALHRGRIALKNIFRILVPLPM